MDFNRGGIFGDPEPGGEPERPMHPPSRPSSPGGLSSSIDPSTGQITFTPDEVAFLNRVRDLERTGEVPGGTSFRLQLNPKELQRAMAEAQRKAIGKKIDEVATREVATAIEVAQGPGLTIKGRRFALKRPPDWAMTLVTWATIATLAWGAFKVVRGFVRSRKGGGARGARRRKKS